MDQDDPEKRIAELERQLAGQNRIVELEGQIAQVRAATPGQDAPVPPLPQWPATPPQSPPSAPTGTSTGFRGAWVSVDGGNFRQVGGQGAGAAFPPQAAEQLAGLVREVVRQAEFAGQLASPGHVGIGSQPVPPWATNFEGQ